MQQRPALSRKKWSRNHHKDLKLEMKDKTTYVDRGTVERRKGCSPIHQATQGHIWKVTTCSQMMILWLRL